MPSSLARRRYYTRLGLAFGAYAALLVPVVWAFRHDRAPSAPWNYVIAVLPALPVFAVIWAILRYVIEEEDEFIRLLHTRASLGATGLTLAICTAWGFLANFTDTAPGSLMYVFMIYCACLCPALAWTHWKAR